MNKLDYAFKLIEDLTRILIYRDSLTDKEYKETLDYINKTAKELRQ